MSFIDTFSADETFGIFGHIHIFFNTFGTSGMTTGFDKSIDLFLQT